MNTKLIAVVLLVGGVLNCQSYGQEPSADEKSALALLGQFSGKWEKRFTIAKSEWSPEEQIKTGTHSCKWILNDRHLQETGQDSDGGNYISIYSYDTAAKQYRMSAFQSNGSTWQMSGKWDARSNTFTWSRDLGDGIRMEASYQLLSAVEFKFSYVAKNDDGKIFFRLEGTGKRIPEKK